MRILQLALFGLLLTQSLFVDAQDELIIEENQAQLLLDDVQNDINELDETQAAKIKEMNEEIKRENDQINKENEIIRNMQRESDALKQQMKTLQEGRKPKDDPDSDDNLN